MPWTTPASVTTAGSIALAIRTHDEGDCLGPYCCVHNPSDHHMNTWPLIHRVDRWPMISERLCSHGVGHPDPDSLDFISNFSYDQETKEFAGIHGCDGCCREDVNE